MSEYDNEIKDLINPRKPTQEELAKLYEEQRKDARKRKEMVDFIMMTQDHDRLKCDCLGCKYWWQSNVVTENNMFFEILPNVKFLIKKKGIDLYLRDYQLLINQHYRGKPIWIANDLVLIKRMVQTQI
jgi:hypothetical protein